MTFLKWHTSVNMDKIVSTSIREFHSPRRHRRKLEGNQSALAKFTSAKTTHLVTDPINEMLEGTPIMYIGSVAVPVDNQSEMIV